MRGFSLPRSSLKPPIRTLTLLKNNLIVLSSTSVKEMLATILSQGLAFHSVAFLSHSFLFVSVALFRYYSEVMHNRYYHFCVNLSHNVLTLNIRAAESMFNLCGTLVQKKCQAQSVVYMSHLLSHLSETGCPSNGVYFRHPPKWGQGLGYRNIGSDYLSPTFLCNNNK